MRTRLHILIAAALIGTSAPISSALVPAVAEEATIGANPTANDLIEALTPERKTRGIRLRSEAVAETQAPAAREPAYVDLPMITFESNSAALTPAARDVLDQLAIALQSEQLGSSRFMLEGHTDAVGSSDYNLSLSEQRARAVREYLASKQIATARLQAVGKGENDLLEATDGPSEANRRVRVVNLGAN